jgi:mycothiol synthase
VELRAPRPDDAEAVLAVIEARDIADLGAPDATLADVLDTWASSETDPARDARVAVLDGTICAYGIVRRSGSFGFVAPAFEGRGVGSRLLGWAETRERELATRPHRQWVADTNERGRELLTAARYSLARSYHRMSRTLDRFDAPVAPPAGVKLRALDVDSDALALHALDAASFDGAPDYVPMSARAFREDHLERHDTDPALTCVAERDGRIVGFALVLRRDDDDAGHVGVLAVAPGEQGNGIGSALLTEAFARIRRAGLTHAELGVASTNPRALRLYERTGMAPRFRVDAYERALEP